MAHARPVALVTGSASGIGRADALRVPCQKSFMSPDLPIRAR
jgi:NADP-dependent 3-hydroxy acid dehydrogenase YdfG